MAGIKRFEEFLSIQNFIFKTLGIDLYDRNARLKYIFFLHLVNTTYQTVGFAGYSFMSFKAGDFAGITMTLAYLGIMLTTDYKLFYFLWRKQQLKELIQEMNAMYPHTAHQQRAFRLTRYLRNYKWITKSYVSLSAILIGIYNVYTVLEYLIFERWLQVRTVGLQLPFPIHLPWNLQDSWAYYVLFVAQFFGSYMSVAGQLAIDLMICAIASQIIMHFDHLASAIAEYRVQCNDAKDMHFLRNSIVYHCRILRLGESMNDIFGLPLLVNFFASSFVICFMGFQVTIGTSTHLFVKLFLLLVCSILQVYMICWYSEEMMNASAGIAVAAYNQQWHPANLRYKKMLLLIVMRAQSPFQVTATNFLKISRQTLTELLQISYKFFTVLRTIYGE